jgi:Tol biopolymer transport system component
VTRQDGEDEVFLTRAPAFQPVWSPDGSLIAFMGLVTDGLDVEGALEVYVIRADGTGLTRLTHRPINTASELRRTSDLAWSPDGSRIAFAAWWDGNAEIYVVGADGAGLTRLTQRQANDRSPRWSADGKRIAFAASNPSGASRRAGLYAISAQGTGLTRLSRAPVDWPISWSP